MDLSTAFSELRLPTSTVALGGGRRLGYTDWGPRSGFPLLSFHGAVGSPLRRCPRMDAALETCGLRHFAVHRPGFGLSDAAPDRTLGSWAADVAAFADAMGLRRFAVLGISAGGPYAVACAEALGARVTAAGIVSTTGPLWGTGALRGRTATQRLGASLASRPLVGRATVGTAIAIARRHPEAMVGLAARRGGARDRAHAEAGGHAAMVEGFLQTTANGVGPMVADLRLALGPWDFDPASISAPVLLWHGARDTTVPLDHALAIAARLPHCRTTVLAQEGHFFFRARAPEILAELAPRRPSPALEPAVAAQA